MGSPTTKDTYSKTIIVPKGQGTSYKVEKKPQRLIAPNSRTVLGQTLEPDISVA